MAPEAFCYKCSDSVLLPSDTLNHPSLCKYGQNPVRSSIGNPDSRKAQKGLWRHGSLCSTFLFSFWSHMEKGVSLQKSRTDGQSTGFNHLPPHPEQNVLRRRQPLGCSIAKDTKTAQAPFAPTPLRAFTVSRGIQMCKCHIQYLAENFTK